MGSQPGESILLRRRLRLTVPVQHHLFLPGRIADLRSDGAGEIQIAEVLYLTGLKASGLKTPPFFFARYHSVVRSHSDLPICRSVLRYFDPCFDLKRRNSKN